MGVTSACEQQAPCHRCERPVRVLCDRCLLKDRTKKGRRGEVIKLFQVGYTQTEIARKLGVSRQSVHQMVSRLRTGGYL